MKTIFAPLRLTTILLFVLMLLPSAHVAAMAKTETATETLIAFNYAIIALPEETVIQAIQRMATENRSLDIKAVVEQQSHEATLFITPGDTYVITAIKHHKNGVLRELIRLGADITTPDRYGNTPLAHACMFKNAEAVNILFEHDNTIIDNDNMIYKIPGATHTINALRDAAKRKKAAVQPEIKYTLLESGIYDSKETMDDMPPLMDAPNTIASMSHLSLARDFYYYRKRFMIEPHWLHMKYLDDPQPLPA